MTGFNLNNDTESLNSDKTNVLPNFNPSANNEIKISSLNTMFNNDYNNDIIKCLPCKALQTYSSLYKHYINIRNDVKNSLLKCGITNTEKALDLIENEYIKCKDIDNNINNNLIKSINDKKNKENKKKSYILIFIQLIILLMFGLFIYFFERRRCICVCPPGASPN